MICSCVSVSAKNSTCSKRPFVFVLRCDERPCVTVWGKCRTTCFGFFCSSGCEVVRGVGGDSHTNRLQARVVYPPLLLLLGATFRRTPYRCFSGLLSGERLIVGKLWENDRLWYSRMPRARPLYTWQLNRRGSPPLTIFTLVAKRNEYNVPVHSTTQLRLLVVEVFATEMAITTIEV